MKKELNQYDMPPLRPEVTRDSFGRYVLPNPGDPNEMKTYTRTTTLASAIADEYNLTQWKLRSTVEGLKSNVGLLEQIDMMADDRSIRDQLQKVADEAMEETGSSVARERGTQLHYFTEAYDGGFLTLAQIPEEYRTEVTAYAEANARNGIIVEPASVERILINTIAKAAGTADRAWVTLPNGERIVGDVKTGKDLSYAWGEICMQLATYANAEAMIEYDAEGNPQVVPAPEVNKNFALVWHIPVDTGKCTLWVIDIKAGWAAMELASEVREYRARKNLARHYMAADFGTPVPQEVRYGTPTEASPTGLTPSAPDANGNVWHPVPGPNNSVGWTTDPSRTDGTTPPATTGDGVPDSDELVQTRAIFSSIVDSAKMARKSKKRRNKAQILADERADSAWGANDVEVFRAAGTALWEAYDLGDGATVDKKTEEASQGVEEGSPNDPDEHTVLDAMTPEQKAALDEFALVKEAQEAGGPVAVEGTGNEHTIPVFVPVSEPETAVQNVRYNAAFNAISVVNTQEEAGAVYSQYSDVWDDKLTEAGTAAIGRATAPPEPPRDPILVELDQCQDQASMAQVYNRHSSAWSDEYTQYGLAVLSNK